MSSNSGPLPLLAQCQRGQAQPQRRTRPGERCVISSPSRSLPGCLCCWLLPSFLCCPRRSSVFFAPHAARLAMEKTRSLRRPVKAALLGEKSLTYGESACLCLVDSLTTLEHIPKRWLCGGIPPWDEPSSRSPSRVFLFLFWNSFTPTLLSVMRSSTLAAAIAIVRR